MKPGWTAGGILPGGDMRDADFEQFLADLSARYRWLPAGLVKHYARLYGTRAHDLLSGAASLDDLGAAFGPLLREREARFLIETEWAQTPQDILERRTKHGLHMTPAGARGVRILVSATAAGGLRHIGDNGEKF